MRYLLRTNVCVFLLFSEITKHQLIGVQQLYPFSVKFHEEMTAFCFLSDKTRSGV